MRATVTALTIACVAIGCSEEKTSQRPDEAEVVTKPPADPRLVRVAAVNTTISSGLLAALIPAFEAQSGLRVELIDSDKVTHGKRGRGKRLFQAARTGHADLVIAHYGKADIEPFVTGGLGEFPRLVFANQVVLIGPPSDPAKIAGMTDAADALARIAASRSPYIANNLDGIKYLADLLWHAAGAPPRGAWYVRGPERKAKAVRLAEARGGYVLFGVQPFLYFKNKHKSRMKILVWKDPVLQRAMATVVVRPDRVPGVNHAGALALQRFLLSAEAQAKVRLFRMKGSSHQHWWPMARSNNPKLLPGAAPPATPPRATARRARDAGPPADTVTARRALAVIDARVSQRSAKMKLTPTQASAAKRHLRRHVDRSPAFRALQQVMPHSTVELARAVEERDLRAAEADRIAVYLVHLVKTLGFAKLARFDINHSHVTGRRWQDIDYTGENMTWQGQKKYWAKRGVVDFKRAEHVHAYMLRAYRMPHFARAYAPRNAFEGITVPPPSAP